MNSYEKWYQEKLYPLQDGVMHIIKKLNTPFYLTGGTALSRHYFNHRYSDDIDLFVNADSNYPDHVTRVYQTLSEAENNNDIRLITDKTRRFKDLSQFWVYSVSDSDTELKIDLINDVSAHFGNNEISNSLGLIDSWENILSNKIAALSRFEPKDVADIWIISKNKKFNWRNILADAKTKEAGLEIDILYNMIKSVPMDILDKIKWIQPVDYTCIAEDLNQIAEDILWGKANSLRN